MSERTSHRQASMKKINSKPKFLNLVNKDQSAQNLPRSTTQGGGASITLLHENKVLDEKAKAMEANAAFTSTLLKLRKKQNKSLKNYLQDMQETTTALEAFMNHSPNKELTSILEVSVKTQQTLFRLLSALAGNLESIDNEIENFQESHLPPALNSKKSFKVSARAYEAAIGKHAKADPQANLKLKEYEMEKEEKEKSYLVYGEAAYYSLHDTNLQQETLASLQLCNDYECYVMFFQKGNSLLDSDRSRMVEYKKSVLDFQLSHNKELKLGGQRPKRLWLPEEPEKEKEVQFQLSSRDSSASKLSGSLGNSKKVFAVPFEALIEREQPENFMLPFLAKCFAYLETPEALQTQGIFRESAPKTKLDALRNKVDQGYPIDEGDLVDAHLVASLVKLFLRSLPEPVLSNRFAKDLVEATDESLSPDIAASKLKTVVDKLPPQNRILLQRLFQLCQAILKYSELNLMSVQSLAIVLGPNIFNIESEGDMIGAIQASNRVFVLLFTHYETVFNRPDRSIRPRGKSSNDLNKKLPKIPEKATASNDRAERLRLREDRDREAVMQELVIPQDVLAMPNLPGLPQTPPNVARAPKAFASLPSSAESSNSSLTQQSPSNVNSSSSGDRDSSVKVLPDPSAKQLPEPSHAKQLPEPANRTSNPNRAADIAHNSPRAQGSPTQPDRPSNSGLDSPKPQPSSPLRSSQENTKPLLKRTSSESASRERIEARQPTALQTSSDGEIEPLKYNDQGAIIPSYPLLTQAQFLSLVEFVPSTADYYSQCSELFASSFSFTRAVTNLNTFNQDEMTVLNTCFQTVAKTIRNMLAIVRDYAQKFPADVSKRILQAANEVRPHIKSLILHVKNFNSGLLQDSSGFIASTKFFIISVYHLCCVCFNASLMDGYSQSGSSCVDLCKRLSRHMQETTNAHRCDARDQLAISLVVNNLQNSTLQFTSLLRSRVFDVPEDAFQEQLSGLVEQSEQTINELFDQAKTLILSQEVQLASQIHAKITTLSKTIQQALSLRPSISASAANVELKMLIAATNEQFQSIFEAHAEEEDPVMRRILELLKDISDKVTLFPNCVTNAAVLNNCQEVVQGLDAIQDIVLGMTKKIDDESLIFTMRTYADAAKQNSHDFQLGALAYIWDIRIEGYDCLKFLAFIKDFSFVTFPFLFNFKDALMLAEQLELDS